MEVYDFGPAAQYLFRPCQLDDDFFDETEAQLLDYPNTTWQHKRIYDERIEYVCLV